MDDALVVVGQPEAVRVRFGGFAVPALVAAAGEDAAEQCINFFTAEIRNPNTRAAYAEVVRRFLGFCEQHGDTLTTIKTLRVAGYVEQLGQTYTIPTVKQHLAAINKFFDYLVVKQVVPHNPARAVRGPRYTRKKGKTPYLEPEDARRLLDSIDVSSLTGLRDRALMAVMLFTFARVSAVIHMRVKDYYPDGKRWRFRFLDKGNQDRVLWAHHLAEEYVDAYLDAAGSGADKDTPLFRTVDKHRQLTDQPMSRYTVIKMVKRRAKAAGFSERTCCHTFRATGITAYMKNGGRREIAQKMAGHASEATTSLYDHSGDEVVLQEIERIAI